MNIETLGSSGSSGIQKVILKNQQSPGDIVMLTAAVRDLHQSHPGKFITDVRTSCPALWENNPYLTPLDENDPEVRVIECHYPLIHQSNQLPYHFIHAFIDYLGGQLGVNIRPTAFKGDVHISEQEKTWYSQVYEVAGDDIPFWLIAAGGKYDFTIKWWEHQRYQEVVDYYRGEILFVQIGEKHHHHPPLEGVLDLRGKTDLRQLVRLMYHAQGVVCPVTFPMHLAAAVETKAGRPKNRPCVVIAGGREPMQWEAYPHHQYLHTNGALPCCDQGGCWKSRVEPIGDGDEKDNPPNLCVDVVKHLPRCMDMITAADVCRAIGRYLDGGVVAPLSEKHRQWAQFFIGDRKTNVSPLELRQQAFGDFKNRYAGRTCYVVGRGPTQFQYEELSKITDPIFFINDAVALEKHATGETFFFAHDANQQTWLKQGLKSTAVLPLDRRMFPKGISRDVNHEGDFVFYQRNKTPGEKLLMMDRDKLAGVRELFTHSGTIHSLLHFVWFCGFERVVFIGCDGINDRAYLSRIGQRRTGYDRRLENLSRSSPWWQYATIRNTQDRLCRKFGLRTTYLGTPLKHEVDRHFTVTPVIPKIAHFTWLGGPPPKVTHNFIEQFKKFHPDWEVRYWLGVPPGMPQDLVDAIYATQELCMRADIIRYWLLAEHGGIYLDTDMYVLRSMEELRRFDHFVGQRLEGQINNAVVGARKGSNAMLAILEEVRQVAQTPGLLAKRTAYGQDLLQRIDRRDPGLLKILPAHYFYIFDTHDSAMRFTRATPEEQQRMIEIVGSRITDQIAPFAVHTWGIPQRHLPKLYHAARSSWVKPLKAGDALLRRVPNEATNGVEIGTGDGRLSAYLLGHNAALKLNMVALSVTNGDVRIARLGEREREEALGSTRFAEGRRKLFRTSQEALKSINGEMMDWIVLNQISTQAEMEAQIGAWLSRLRPGGFILGYTFPEAAEKLAAGGVGIMESVPGECWLLKKRTDAR